tara:strand:- start:882 stop:1160 length:279 start_codon:yes stop_codon:yes gene_type:complete
MSAAIPKAMVGRLRYLRKLYAEAQRKKKLKQRKGQGTAEDKHYSRKLPDSYTSPSGAPLNMAGTRGVRSRWATPTNRKNIERMIKLLRSKKD